MNHTTPTCPAALKMSKPLPERAGSHQWPCVKGERSAVDPPASARPAIAAHASPTANRRTAGIVTAAAYRAITRAISSTLHE